MLTKYLNAIYNTQVWSQTQIYQKFLSYLLFGQYFPEDVAYTLTSYIILSYNSPKANYLKNTISNKQFLHIYINIEHIFDILKKI